MKPKKIPFLGLIALIVVITIVTSCNQQVTVGKIPVNEDSVKRHILSIENAIAYTKRFRTNRDSAYRQFPQIEKQLNLGQAESFNRDAIAVLLNQNDSTGAEAAGVRIYYGSNEGGEIRLVLVPYDKNGNDIINKLVTEKAVSIPGVPSAKAFDSGGQTIENGQRCPTACSSTSSGLNGGQ